MAHDEHVVRLLERDALLDHQAPDARAAVVAQVAVQLLDPRLGREDERDLRLAHGFRRAGIAAWSRRRDRTASSCCNGVAPVARTSVIVPVSSADAIRAGGVGVDRDRDAGVVGSLERPAPAVENASTCTSVAT